MCASEDHERIHSHPAVLVAVEDSLGSGRTLAGCRAVGCHHRRVLDRGMSSATDPEAAAAGVNIVVGRSQALATEMVVAEDNPAAVLMGMAAPLQQEERKRHQRRVETQEAYVDDRVGFDWLSKSW